MALTKDSTGYYLEPSTGQYYTLAPQPTYGGKGYSPYSNMMFGMNRPQEDTSNYLTVDGTRYKQFTGNAPGISAGIKSMADQLTNKLSSYTAQAPATLAQLFPSLSAPVAQNTQATQGMYGAGRFLSPSTGGLLALDFSAPGTKSK